MLLSDDFVQEMGFDMSEQPKIELTKRELAIAEEAARIAVRSITDDFYKGVGRTVIQRFLIVIGAIAVGWAVGKGYVTPTAGK